MLGHVDVNHLAASLVEDKEDVQDPEARRRHREEGDRDNDLSVVPKERHPPLDDIPRCGPTWHAPRDGSL